jgi:hypothetical protein
MITETEQLKQRINRIKEIGAEITALQEESKKLRKEVAFDYVSKFATLSEDTPVRLLVDGHLVLVLIARGNKDYTVTFEKLIEL